jgi:tetratricopeptide (TPR) repeat protein
MSANLETWTKLAPPPEPLQKGQEWNVFLSYRSVNRIWVINLYDVLRAQGHKVFLDQCALAAGDKLTRKLESALDGSQAGVLVWSSAAADSDWVRDEYEVMERRAKNGRFHFVPTRLDSTKLPSFAESRVFLDFSQYPDGPNGGELLRLLHAVVGKPLTPEAARFAAEQDELAKRAGAQIKTAVANGAAGQLQTLFAEGGTVWSTSSALSCAAAEGLTKLKKNDEAIEMLTAIEQRFPRALRPKQLLALALARRGAEGDLDRAQGIVGELYALNEKDPETLGIYGRTWMDRYQKSGNILHLKKSRDLYAEAFALAQDDYYTGVNAAAKSVLLGTGEDLERARDYGQQVLVLVGSDTVPGDYWKTATVGEVHLMVGNHGDAAQRYADAVAMAPDETGSHETTWKQACRLMKAMGTAPAERERIRTAFAHLPDCPS